MRTVYFSFLALLLLGGCSQTKDALGLERKAPNEFDVVRRAPLTLPPSYDLRPPQPGAPRPQEESMDNQAKVAVFGDGAVLEDIVPDSAEDAFLEEAGAHNPDPNIRNVVNSESNEIAERNRPVVKRIFKRGDKDKAASIVDAEKEVERLYKNEEEGKPLTEGETPSIDD